MADAKTASDRELFEGADAAEPFGYSHIPRRPRVELEVVLPVSNEEERLPGALRALATYLAPQPFSAAVVVVDTGSSDHTVDVAAGWGCEDVPVHVLGCSRQERGAALLEGLVTSQARFAGSCPIAMAALIHTLDFVMPHLWAGDHVVGGARRVCDGGVQPDPLPRAPATRRVGGSALRRRARALADSDAEAVVGFSFFELGAGLPLISACLADGRSFDVDALALARQAGLAATEV